MSVPSVNAERERIALLLQMGRYQLAEEAARRCLAANPADWRAAVLLANALRMLDRLAEAQAAAATAVGLASEAASPHVELAHVYGQQGQFEPAHQAMLEALRLDPSRSDCHGYRAQLFYLRGRFKAAVGCAEEGLHSNPRHADCLLWRALAQEGLDQPAAADEDFRRLLHLAPNSALLHNRLGRVLLRRYEPRQAEIHLATALRQQPDEAATLLPLLRQARRRATWPAWLLRGARHEAAERTLWLASMGKMAVLHAVAGLLYPRTWWLTRHDPIFTLTRTQKWGLALGLWLSIPMVLSAVIFLGDYFDWFDASKPFTILQMLGMVAGGGLFHAGIMLLKRQISA